MSAVKTKKKATRTKKAPAAQSRTKASKAKASSAKTSKGRKGARKTSSATSEPFFTAMVTRLKTAGGAAFGGVVLVAVAVLWIGGYFGMVIEATTKTVERQVASLMVSAGLDVQKITILGRDETSLPAVRNALGPINGTSMLHFDPHAARARIEDIGWVRSASVSRLWPNHVHISVREREPAAVWQVTGTLRLIDREGAIIREIGSYEYSGLPLIVGAGAPEAASTLLRLLGELGDLEERVTALVRVSDRRWNLRLNNRMDIKLPEFGFEKALRDLAVLQDTVNVLDHEFEYIDLRDPERTYFRCQTTGDGRVPSQPTAKELLSQGFSCTPDGGAV